MLDLLFAVFALHPFLNVEITWPVQWDRVAIEQIGHHDEVARLGQILFIDSCSYSPVRSELVGYELGIVEAMADHVCNATSSSV